jgi:hypothetical protein
VHNRTGLTPRDDRKGGAGDRKGGAATARAALGWVQAEPQGRLQAAIIAPAVKKN